MSANKSRHLLPMSSIIFKSSPDLRSPLLPTNPTLVDLHEAQDTSITALPMTSSIKPRTKESIWSRIVSKITGLFGGKAKESEVGAEREMEIGSPTDFKHEWTGFGDLRLLVKKRVDEDEWEDVEDGRRV
jgi:hypothetical protein